MKRFLIFWLLCSSASEIESSWWNSCCCHTQPTMETFIWWRVMRMAGTLYHHHVRRCEEMRCHDNVAGNWKVKKFRKTRKVRREFAWEFDYNWKNIFIWFDSLEFLAVLAVTSVEKDNFWRFVLIATAMPSSIRFFRSPIDASRWF